MFAFHLRSAVARPAFFRLFQPSVCVFLIAIYPPPTHFHTHTHTSTPPHLFLPSFCPRTSQLMKSPLFHSAVRNAIPGQSSPCFNYSVLMSTSRNILIASPCIITGALESITLKNNAGVSKANNSRQPQRREIQKRGAFTSF